MLTTFLIFSFFFFLIVSTLCAYFHQEPEDQEYFSQFVTLQTVRRAIHVGNLTFHDGSEVEKHLLLDVMQSVKPWLGVLMDHYRVSRRFWMWGGLAPSAFFNVLVISSPVQVLIYSGQLDVIVAAPLTERFLPTVNWTGAAEYMKAPRFHWKLQPDDTEVAGYVRSVGEFYQVSGSLISVTSPTPTPALCTNPFFFFPPHAGHHPWGRAHFAL